MENRDSKPLLCLFVCSGGAIRSVLAAAFLQCCPLISSIHPLMERPVSDWVLTWFHFPPFLAALYVFPCSPKVIRAALPSCLYCLWLTFPSLFYNLLFFLHKGQFYRDNRNLFCCIRVSNLSRTASDLIYSAFLVEMDLAS